MSSSSRSNTSFHTATSKSTSGSTTSNNNHVKEILEKAYDTLQRVAGTELPSLKENTVATDVDEAIINMVQAFNTMDIDHRVSLYNGINGVALVTLDPVADKQFKNHVFILLGHTLVTLSEATLNALNKDSQPFVRTSLANRTTFIARLVLFVCLQAGVTEEVATRKSGVYLPFQAYLALYTLIFCNFFPDLLLVCGISLPEGTVIQ
jgi:hypothetical protein